MLLIRAKQMDVLSAYARELFESQLVEHLAASFPNEYRELATPGVRDLIRQGVTKSANYGMSSCRDVASFVELMMEFGSEFDTDPKQGEARGILENPKLSPSTKIQILFLEMKGKPREF